MSDWFTLPVCSPQRKGVTGGILRPKPNVRLALPKYVTKLIVSGLCKEPW